METAALLIIKKIFSSIVTKKRLIGWVSAVLLALGAGVAGMQTPEFKAAVCEAPTIEAQK